MSTCPYTVTLAKGFKMYTYTTLYTKIDTKIVSKNEVLLYLMLSLFASCCATYCIEKIITLSVQQYFG